MTIDLHSTHVDLLDRLETEAQRIADAVTDSDPAFAVVLRHAVRLYLAESWGAAPRLRWTSACLIDALSPEDCSA